MTNEELEKVVRIVLKLGYDHWLKHGTPIKPDDAPLVAGDVRGAVEIASDRQER